MLVALPLPTKPTVPRESDRYGQAFRFRCDARSARVGGRLGDRETGASYYDMSIEYDDDEQCPFHRLMPVDRPGGLRIVGGRCQWRRQIEERHRPAAEGGEQPAGQGGLQRQCVKQPMDCLNTRCRGNSELSGDTGWVRCYANRSTMGTRPDQRAGGTLTTIWKVRRNGVFR